MSDYYILIDLIEIKMEIVGNDVCIENIGVVIYVYINNSKLEFFLYA